MENLLCTSIYETTTLMYHQIASLTARYLEAHAIPTVITGCAKDIVEPCGVPRLLSSDFPLGHPAGKPFDVESQRLTLPLVLQLLESAPAARATFQSPPRWSDDPLWKRDFCNIDNLSQDDRARRRQEFNAQKA